MIQFDSEQRTFRLGGSVIGLTAQTAQVVHGVYNYLLRTDPKAADEYKLRLTQLLDDIFVTEEELDKKEQEAKQALRDEFGSAFIDALEAIVDGKHQADDEDDDNSEFRDHFFGQ